MAITSRVIIKQSQLKNFLDEITTQELDRRSKNVLTKAKELVPIASGDFRDSLRIVKTFAKGKPVARITSNDPDIKAIRFGTQGPYSISPANVGRIQSWMNNVSIPSSRTQAIRMAKAIAFNGTSPAGTHSGMTVDEALKEAMKEASK